VVFFSPEIEIMKMLPLKYFLYLSLYCLASVAVAQGSNSVLATVNGVKITLGQLDQYVLLATAQGAQDTKGLRENFLNDLVVREAIVQDVKKTGLLSKGSNALKLKIAEQDAIMGLWFAQYFAEHPISEAEVRSEYEKQAAISKDPRNSKEYQISQIVLPNESEAQQVISELKRGVSFDKLAKDKSIDKATSQNGGSVGWILPSQLSSPMNDLVVGLGKGDVISKPVQIGSAWYVVKVNDQKPFVLPSFDQAKVTISQALLQKERRDAIQSLMKSVKIASGVQ
jgi:peptidyl-prolyl cis-trans isomerase C